MDSKNTKSQGLRPGFTPLGIWAFSIGTGIGWGSFIVTCNTYLQKSGLLGTIFGLLVGMAVIFLITWNLQYMIRNSRNAGGIYSFAKRVKGKDFGFLAAWFVILTYMAILWANITSVPLFARFFLGDTFHFGFHYSIFGYEVWFGEALLSVCSILLIGVLCTHSSSKLPNLVVIISALIFTACFTVCAVLAILRHGNSFSYSPLYADNSNTFGQIVRIAVISPWAFIGFENVSHFSEEYSFPVKKVRKILIWSVLVTTVLYILVSLLSVSAYPPEYESWMAYIQDMGNLSGIKAVPAFYAANYYLGQTGITILMFALFGVILTSLIGNLMAVSRLLYAAGREDEAPKAFRKLNGHGSPENAILLIVAVSVFVPFLGRTAIGWIVDVTTLGATIIYGIISYSVYIYARKAKMRREQFTGILGFLLMAAFLLVLLIPGLLPFHAMETESYVLFIVWSLLGLAYFRSLIRKDQHREYGKSIIVWILLLLLVLFASMMWVSRATESAAEESVAAIFEYHESHPTDDSDEAVKANRIAFLKEQAEKISSTNTLYTLVSLGLFLLSTLIMLNNYRDTRMLWKKLSAAEEAAKDARIKEERIAYARLGALTGSFLCVYVVNPETGVYREFTANDDYEVFAQAKEGKDFFLATREAAKEYSHPEDIDRFLSLFTRENVFKEIERNGHFTITYRLVSDGKPKYVQLKAAMVDEAEGKRLIVGLNDIDANVRQEEEYARRLAQAQNKANIDALTGVKNKYAYQNAEEQLNCQIAEQLRPEFAITVLDVNDLKKVNDMKGHQAGDQYLRDACRIICTTFSHSPVFRIGGDEFAVISQGNDYARIDELVQKIDEHNEKAMQTGGIVIACGMAKYKDEENVKSVFRYADRRMYEDKKALKSCIDG